GEVKCSSEAKWPPQVMSGRSGGLAHQLDALAHNLGTIYQLLQWLLPRVKHTEHETAFNSACARYFNSERRDLALFGILVRDQEVRETDLQTRGRDLAGRLQKPTRCRLLWSNLRRHLNRWIIHLNEDIFMKARRTFDSQFKLEVVHMVKAQD